jgi:hypothetical protein
MASIKHRQSPRNKTVDFSGGTSETHDRTT